MAVRGLPRRPGAGGFPPRPGARRTALSVALVVLLVPSGAVPVLRAGDLGIPSAGLSAHAVRLGAAPGPSPAGRSPTPLAAPCGSGPAPPACGGAVPGAGASSGALVWSNLTPAFGPSPTERGFAASAFDPLLGRFVLFGGEDPYGAALGDLWESENGTWGPLFVPGEVAPGPRWGATLTYDAADGFLLLFGGRNATAYLSDSWALNATGWHRLTAEAGPSPRAFAQAAYDALGGRVLLFGGASADRAGGLVGLNDTWAFRTDQWANLTPTIAGPSPPTTLAGAFAYDPSSNACVLFGGETGGTPSRLLGETWSFSAGGWSNATAAASAAPSARWGAAMVYDARAGELLLTGGETATGASAETWAFIGSSWQNATESAPAPPARAGGAFVFEPTNGRAILFGGSVPGTFGYYADTWAYGLPPLEAILSATPTAGVAPLNVTFAVNVSGGLAPYALAWTFGDGGVARNVTDVVHSYGVVGNFSATVAVEDAAGATASETVVIAVLTGWENQHQWAPVSGASAGPGPRTSPQMAYDPDFQAVILFGGYSPSDSALSDTWEFVNNVWINLSANLSAPPGRWGGGLTYDPMDHLLLLFGGRTVAGYLNDTWGFTPSGWEPLTPPAAPSPRGFFGLTFDAADGYVLLMGGGTGNVGGSPWEVYNDTWEYRGGSWVNATRSVAGGPPRVLGAAATYDPAVGAVVWYGGTSVAPGGTPGTCYPSAATWLYRGGSWSVSSTAQSPGGRLFAAAAYDATDAGVLLFGGAENLGGLCYSTRDTYSLAGGDWASLDGNLVTSPPARDAAGAAFDGSEGVVVLFGGTSNGLYLGDTWVYPAPLNGSLSTTVGNPNGTFGSGGGGGGGGGSGGGSGGSGNGTALALVVGYSISATRASGPFVVLFSATASGGVAPLNFTWDFGDSSPVGEGAAVSHRYLYPGTYDPVLTVRDGAGTVALEFLPRIEVVPGSPVSPGTPVLATSGADGAVSAGLTVLVAGAAAVAGVVYAWGRYQRRLEEEGDALVRDIEETKSPEDVPPRTR